jgi:hypothetical protein
VRSYRLWQRLLAQHRLIGALVERAWGNGRTGPPATHSRGDVVSLAALSAAKACNPIVMAPARWHSDGPPVPTGTFDSVALGQCAGSQTALDTTSFLTPHRTSCPGLSWVRLLPSRLRRCQVSVRAHRPHAARAPWPSCPCCCWPNIDPDSHAASVLLAMAFPTSLGRSSRVSLPLLILRVDWPGAYIGTGSPARKAWYP